MTAKPDSRSRGRPKVSERLAPLNLYVPAELVAWLDAQAIANRRTRSEMGRVMLEQARSQQRKRGARK